VLILVTPEPLSLISIFLLWYQVDDLRDLIKLYTDWHLCLIPYYSFKQFVWKVKKVGVSNHVRVSCSLLLLQLFMPCECINTMNELGRMACGFLYCCLEMHFWTEGQGLTGEEILQSFMNRQLKKTCQQVNQVRAIALLIVNIPHKSIHFQ
jgi:hypothetical protein